MTEDCFTVASSQIREGLIVSVRCFISSFACLFWSYMLWRGSVGDSFTVASAQVGMTGVDGVGAIAPPTFASTRCVLRGEGTS